MVFTLNTQSGLCGVQHVLMCCAVMCRQMHGMSDFTALLRVIPVAVAYREASPQVRSYQACLSLVPALLSVLESPRPAGPQTGRQEGRKAGTRMPVLPHTRTQNFTLYAANKSTLYTHARASMPRLCMHMSSLQNHEV
jgi:hypothetical protein